MEELARVAGKDNPFLTQSHCLSVEAVFYFPATKAPLKAKDWNSLMWKGDIDNHIKFLLDTLKGCLYDPITLPECGSGVLFPSN